ncbi:MAG: sulfurtransferase complex subunit TusC [Halioglobus sp.]
MSSSNKNRLLIIVRHSPYGSSLARAGLETALAAAVFEQPLELLFMGDGVLHLIAEQDTSTRAVKNSFKLLSSFSLYDIHTIHADDEALARYGVDVAQLPLNVTVLDTPAIQQLLAKQDHILEF